MLSIFTLFRAGMSTGSASRCPDAIERGAFVYATEVHSAPNRKGNGFAETGSDEEGVGRTPALAITE